MLSQTAFISFISSYIVMLTPTLVLPSATINDRSCCHCNFNDTAYMDEACGTISSFMTTLQILMMARCDIADPCRRLGRDEVPIGNWYDFIIVGAGVAGPIVAKRLSDNPGWRVLLVEAGPEEPSLTAVPGLAFHTVNTSLDWKYKTEPTKPYPTACLEHGGVCHWPRGKMVGGTSAMNGMMYARGHPEIFDKWSRDGNRGWSYEEIKHYFERAENPEFNQMIDDQPYQTTPDDSPMHIKYFAHYPAFTKDLLKAADELGYETGPRFGYNQTGFMVAPMMIKDGLRGTTARCYLGASHRKKNLHVLINAHVTNLLVNKWSSTVYGIELVDKAGKRHTLKVNKEVILTAGAIGSPQILLQSGIGPKHELEKVGIPVIKNLPVGKNLQNHVSVGIKMTIESNYYETLSLDAVNEFVLHKSGPLSSTGLTQVTAFLESKYTKPGIPDIQVFFDGFSSTCPKTGMSHECVGGSLGTCSNRRKIVARPTALLTRSRGYLKLRSKNPFDYPLIYPNYFTDQMDMKVLLEGVKKVIELTNTRTMSKWDLRLDETPHPWCSGYHFGTDAYWECLIRTQTGPENHQSGTCKMGPASDPESVVDSELRVHGLLNIRVADASIMPILPNANPVASIIMVAEKVSDLVQRKWSRK